MRFRVGAVCLALWLGWLAGGSSGRSGPDVSEELVDQQLDVLRNRFGSREAVERPAADGDIVTINLVASRDGEPLADATANDVEHTIGSGQMLDGLAVRVPYAKYCERWSKPLAGS